MSLLIVSCIDAILIPLIIAPFVVYFVLFERKKAEEELKDLAITDELTGLHNRRGFFALAEQQIRIAARSGKIHYLVYLDLDGFKYINDTLGHDIGDEALKTVADILITVFRTSDIIAPFTFGNSVLMLVAVRPRFIAARTGEENGSCLHLCRNHRQMKCAKDY